jgi:catechol 2,3-dioxygenase-like lactoylglutathione lyase family enzyme
MPGLLLNIDVPDLADGVRFYTAALGLSVGRRFDNTFVELLGTVYAER